MKTFKAAELLIEKIKKDYQDDIAVVVMMGSNLYQETHKKSDLDLYFVPKTERGFNLGSVFIIDEIGYDFWPISWDRMKRIASHDERISSIISEGKILYYGNEDDLLQFQDLQKLAKDQTNISSYQDKSRHKFMEVYPLHFALMKLDHLSDVRRKSIEMIYVLVETLALWNMTSIKRGRGKLLSEVLAMKKIPIDFKSLYENIFQLHDIKLIKDTLCKLIDQTHEIISHSHDQKNDLAQRGTGFYEETINFYNKIERAYEVGDYYTALYAASEILIEIDQNLGDLSSFNVEFPDLLDAYDPHDLKKIYDASKIHQQKLVHLLESEGVHIQRFKDEHELKQFLDTL